MVLQSKRRQFDYPAEVASRHGGYALRDKPKVIVGTIHSVKGGEADAVYLFPDLSPNGMRQWHKRGVARNSILRLFYVGMTRAREELVLCRPSSWRRVEW